MLQYITHSENNKNQVKYLPMVNISVTHCLVRDLPTTLCGTSCRATPRLGFNVDIWHSCNFFYHAKDNRSRTEGYTV